MMTRAINEPNTIASRASRDHRARACAAMSEPPHVNRASLRRSATDMTPSTLVPASPSPSPDRGWERNVLSTPRSRAMKTEKDEKTWSAMHSSLREHKRIEAMLQQQADQAQSVHA